MKMFRLAKTFRSVTFPMPSAKRSDEWLGAVLMNELFSISRSSIKTSFAALVVVPALFCGPLTTMFRRMTLSISLSRRGRNRPGNSRRRADVPERRFQYTAVDREPCAVPRAIEALDSKSKETMSRYSVLLPI